MFTSPPGVGCGLVVTATLLILTRRMKETAEIRFTTSDALILGIAQGLAIMPGISRSGLTIAVALGLGATRPSAARLSFLIAIPATIGAAVLEGGAYGLPPLSEWPTLFAGVVMAAVVGYLALIWLNRWLHQGRLHYFAYYLYPLGIATWVFSA